MNIQFADRLVALRREQGWSQEELALRLGVSRQAVSKWERAESSPDTDNLIALARLYGISLDELLLHAPEEGEQAQAREDREVFAAAEAWEAGEARLEKQGQAQGSFFVAAHPGPDGCAAPALPGGGAGRAVCPGGQPGLPAHRLPAGKLASGVAALPHHPLLLHAHQPILMQKAAAGPLWLGRQNAPPGPVARAGRRNVPRGIPRPRMQQAPQVRSTDLWGLRLSKNWQKPLFRVGYSPLRAGFVRSGRAKPTLAA